MWIKLSFTFHNLAKQLFWEAQYRIKSSTPIAQHSPYMFSTYSINPN